MTPDFRTPSPETLAQYGERPCPFPWPEVAGLYIGGCIETKGGRFRRQAHAHNHRTDPNFGWICVLSHRRVFGQSRTNGIWTPTDRPSQLMLHEYAHILTPNHGHDHHWMLAAHQLGYRFKAHEKDRTPTSWARFQKLLRDR